MIEVVLNTNLPIIGLGLVTVYFLWNIVQAIYNVTFHPLAKFPGPWMAGATPLPYAYQRLRGNQPGWIKDLHDKYGSVVRYLPDTLSYTDPDAWDDIFGHKASKSGEMPKDKEVKMAFIGGDDSIMRMDQDDHTRVRRLLAPALSDKALREQQTLLEGHVRLFIDKVRKAASGENDGKIDIMRWFNFTTFDIISDLAFGEPLGVLKQGEWTPWLFAINKSIPITTNIAAISRYFPLIGVFLKHFVPASALKSLDTHVKFSKQQVDSRIKRGTDRPDFWKYILRNEDKDGGSLSTRENHALGMTLMVAGSETTAAALGGLMNQLMHNRDKYEKLVEEIRGEFQSADDLNLDALQRLPYLHACIREGLRLYPPTPIGQQRVVTPGGRMICGRFVGEGMLVTISHWATYRDAGHWHRPLDFCPERWLPENQKSGPFANDKREALHPFSYGPRDCIGKNLAYHEARLILTTLLWNFDLELCDESRDWANQKVYGLATRGPLMIRPTAAERSDK